MIMMMKIMPKIKIIKKILKKKQNRKKKEQQPIKHLYITDKTLTGEEREKKIITSKL